MSNSSRSGASKADEEPTARTSTKSHRKPEVHRSKAQNYSKELMEKNETKSISNSEMPIKSPDISPLDLFWIWLPKITYLVEKS